ncbi:MAG: hypothetical protein ACM32K_08380 [Syntrophaceae bacterium]
MEVDERLLNANRHVARVPTAEHLQPVAGVAKERRRAVRAHFPEPCPAQLQMRDAVLVNISRLGVLAEHANPAWPGQLYHLSFTVQGTPVRLLARAIHAFASNRLTGGEGEGQIVFRTGMEFVALENDTGDFISAYVDGLCQKGQSER